MKNNSLKIFFEFTQEAQTAMAPLRKTKWSRLIFRIFILTIITLAFPSASLADGGSGGGGSGGGGGSSGGSSAGNSATPNKAPNDATQTGAFDVREDYRRANKLSIPFGPPTKRCPDGLDEVKDRESQGPATVDHGGPVYIWPVKIMSATSKVPTKRDTGITKNRLQTFGLPVSDTQFQMIHRMDQQIMLEEMFDPERIMWLGASLGTSQVQDASNSFANVARNQAASAIDFVGCSMYNFTVDDNNRWNKIRNQLFIPMAFLLLLPGAVLAQVRVIVAAGMPIAGSDANPFEGITRSIVAVFLIPATYLVVNYGIDVNNSITFTIANEYKRIFGADMYRDAVCNTIRAFPVRQSHENRNGIFKEVKDWTKEGDTPAGGLESRALLTKTEDPCSGNIETDPDRADEQAPFLSVGQRFVTNSSNAVLTSTWNLLCAFQFVFLCYLWLVGPVIAALWVYPLASLRGAFGGWCEGVITLCFWALFWNTVVLLMACFRGVDETGSVICSALNFLAVQCVKSAFDFADLVKKAGTEAAGQVGGKQASSGGKSNATGHGNGSKAGHGTGRGTSHGTGHGTGHGHGQGHGTGHASAPNLNAGHGTGSIGQGAAAAGANAHGVSTSLSLSPLSAGAHGVGSALGAGERPGGLGGVGEKLAGGIDAAGAVPLTAGAAADRAAAAANAVSNNFDLMLSSPPMSMLNNITGGDVNLSATAQSILAGGNTNFSNLSIGGDMTAIGISGKDAAALIGPVAAASIPREGTVVSAAAARADFNNFASTLNSLNSKDPANEDARNQLAADWRSLLGDDSADANGLLQMPPSNALDAVTAASNYNVSGAMAAGVGSGTFPEGFSNTFAKINGAVDSALTSFGTGNVNAEAARGIASLARDVVDVGPSLVGMEPRAMNAVMENWNQRAEAYTAQLSAPGTVMPSEVRSATATELTRARETLDNFQTQYATPVVNYGGGGGDAVYGGGYYAGGGATYSAVTADGNAYGGGYGGGGTFARESQPAGSNPADAGYYVMKHAAPGGGGDYAQPGYAQPSGSGSSGGYYGGSSQSDPYSGMNQGYLAPTGGGGGGGEAHHAAYGNYGGSVSYGREASSSGADYYAAQLMQWVGTQPVPHPNPTTQHEVQANAAHQQGLYNHYMDQYVQHYGHDAAQHYGHDAAQHSVQSGYYADQHHDNTTYGGTSYNTWGAAASHRPQEAQSKPAQAPAPQSPQQQQQKQKSVADAMHFVKKPTRKPKPKPPEEQDPPSWMK